VIKESQVKQGVVLTSCVIVSLTASIESTQFAKLWIEDRFIIVSAEEKWGFQALTSDSYYPLAANCKDDLMANVYLNKVRLQLDCI